MKNNDIRFTLKKLRLDSGFSQKELEELANLPATSLSRIENGTKYITINELLEILSIFNVSATSFFDKVVSDSYHGTLTGQYNKLLFHYKKHRQNNMHLVSEEIKTFRSIEEQFKKEKIFKATYDVQWFLQLPQLFPSYFEPVPLEMLKLNAYQILKKNDWVLSDYAFFACTLPFLTKEVVNKLLKNLPSHDFINTNSRSKNLIEPIFENMSDFYLVHYNEFEPIDLDNKLSLVFKYWNDYLSVFDSMTSKIIYQHNYAMYEILFEKREKDVILTECKNRHDALTVLGFETLANNLQEDAENYKNRVHGVLFLNLTL